MKLSPSHGSKKPTDEESHGWKNPWQTDTDWSNILLHPWDSSSVGLFIRGTLHPWLQLALAQLFKIDTTIPILASLAAMVGDFRVHLQFRLFHSTRRDIEGHGSCRLERHQRNPVRG